MSKVTVITFTYNRSKWLQETIDSVLMQKGVELEYLILDNGSDPRGDTQRVLKQYASDPRFTLFHVDENNADHPSLHDMATGDFITNLPDDDFLIGDDSLARRAAVLRQNPDLGFVFSSVRGHNAEGHTLGPLGMGRISDHDKLAGAAPFADLFVSCFAPYPSVMFPRKMRSHMWKKHVMNMGCCSDWGTWTSIAQKHPAAFLVDPTVSLRQHPGQDSNIRGIRGGWFNKANFIQWTHYIQQEGYKPRPGDWELMANMTKNTLIQQYQQELDESRKRLNSLYERSK